MTNLGTIFTTIILVLFVSASPKLNANAQTYDWQANTTWNDDCTRHFFKSTPPTRRANCTNTSICISLCHYGKYASLQNAELRTPEWSAQLLDVEEQHLAAKNDFARPSWKLLKSISEFAQAPVTHDLYNGVSRSHDKGHLISKGNLDYTEFASDTSFNMAAIVPQNRNCNSGAWVSLEKKVRAWVTEKNQSLYAVVAIGYRDFDDPSWSSANHSGGAMIVPDYMVYLLCDPNVSSSVAFVAESDREKCGTNATYKMLQRYRTVREAEQEFLNGTKIFHDDCNPCQVNGSHWNFDTDYVENKDTPELCATTTTTTIIMTTTSTSDGNTTSADPNSTTTTTTTTDLNTTTTTTTTTSSPVVATTSAVPVGTVAPPSPPISTIPTTTLAATKTFRLRLNFPLLALRVGDTALETAIRSDLARIFGTTGTIGVLQVVQTSAGSNEVSIVFTLQPTSSSSSSSSFSSSESPSAVFDRLIASDHSASWMSETRTNLGDSSASASLLSATEDGRVKSEDEDICSDQRYCIGGFIFLVCVLLIFGGAVYYYRKKNETELADAAAAANGGNNTSSSSGGEATIFDPKQSDNEPTFFYPTN